MCYYIIQNFIVIIYVILTTGSTSKDLGGGASVYLTLRLLMAPAHVMPSRLPPRDRDCVYVSRPWRGASPSVRSNARLFVALRDRPGHAPCGVPRRGIHLEVYVAQDAYGLQRADIARVLPVALSYVASSLAEPRPRIRESASLYT